MDPRTAAKTRRTYEEFEPTIEWANEEGSDTLLVFLPAFQRSEIKVQITSSRNIRVMGERRVGENTWSRFHKEVPVSSNHDTNKISAKFENGILYVKLPKVIVSAQPPQPQPQLQPREEEKKPAPESPKPSEPKTEPQPQTGQKKEMDQPRAGSIKEKQTAEKPYLKEPTTLVKFPEEKPEGVEGESSKADDLNNVSGAALQRKKSEGLVQGDEIRNEKQETDGDSQRQSGEKMEKYYTNGSRKQTAEGYKQVIADSVTKLKKPGNLANLVLASLLVLVLLICIKSALTSKGKMQLELLEDL